MNLDNLEYVKCNICGADDTTLRFKAKARQSSLEFAVVQCQKCQLTYVNPRPSKESIATFYLDEYYRPMEGSTYAAEWYRKVLLKLSPWVYHKLQGLFFQLLKLPRGRLLDIGCGDGKYLRPFIDRGWEVHGIDTSPSAAELARSVGVNVSVGEITEARFPNNYFNLILMRHSLEHLHDPSYVLKEVHRIMAGQGVLYIEVPSIDRPEAALDRLLKQDSVLVDVPRHLYHFSPHTLQLLLQKCGFHPIRRRYIPVLYYIIGRGLRDALLKRLKMKQLVKVLIYITLTLGIPLGLLITFAGMGATMQLIAYKGNEKELAL